MSEAIVESIADTKKEIMAVLAANGQADISNKLILKYLVILEEQIDRLARVHLECEARKWVNSLSARFMQTVTVLILVGLGIVAYEIFTRGLKLP